MAVKSIIDIEVNDEAFKRFYALFEQYTGELEGQSDKWGALGVAMGESTQGLEAGALSSKQALALAAAQATVISEALKDATKAQGGLETASKKSGKAMELLRRSSEGVGTAVHFIAGGIVKLLAFGGLGSIFGAIGVDRLADVAFGRVRAAGQLGITPGLLSSFQVNAQQFLATSALEAAANTQIDISKAGELAVLGIDFGRAQRMNTSDLAFEELKSARSAFIDAQKRGISPMQVPAIMSYLALGGNIGDVRLAAQTPLADLVAAQRTTRRDEARFGFDRATGQAWTKLKVALDGAGQQIETTFIRGLAPLAPQIGELAKSVADLVSGALGNKSLRNLLDEAAGGIENLAKFLETVDWDKVGGDVATFGEDAATVVKWISDKLGWLLGPIQIQKGSTIDRAWQAQQGLIDANKQAWDWLFHGAQTVKTWFGEFNIDQMKPIAGTAAAAALPSGAAKYGYSSSVPGLNYDALLPAIAAHESPGNVVNKIGAMGYYQFMPDTLDSIMKQDPRFAPWVKKYGIGTKAMYNAFMQNKQLQDWAALDNIQNAIAAGAKTPLDIGEYWLGGPGGLAHPGVSDAGPNGPGTTAYQHGVDIQRTYDELNRGPATGSTQHLEKAINKALSKRTQKPATVSISNSTSARVAVSVNAAGLG